MACHLSCTPYLDRSAVPASLHHRRCSEEVAARDKRLNRPNRCVPWSPQGGGPESRVQTPQLASGLSLGAVHIAIQTQCRPFIPQHLVLERLALSCWPTSSASSDYIHQHSPYSQAINHNPTSSCINKTAPTRPSFTSRTCAWLRYPVANAPIATDRLS